MRSPNTEYIQGVDHLRAFAAVLMVFYHGLHEFSQAWIPFVPGTSQWPVASNPFGALVIEGHTAVALFMTLSGFIFAIVSLDKTIDYGSFIRNRILRIFPLFVVLLFVGVYSTSSYSSSKHLDFAALAGSILFLSNTSGSLFAPPFTDLLWTIAVEFQFYLLFPFLITFVQREGPKVLLKLIVFFLVLRIASVLSGGNPRDISYWSILGRMDQFCAGILFAWIFIHRRNWFRNPALQLFISAAGLLTTLFILNRFGGWPSSAPWKIVFHTIEGILWGYLIVSYLCVSSHIPKTISKVLCYVGSISFSIYLLHWVVVSLMMKNQLLYDFPLEPYANALVNALLFALPITLLISALSYHAIELPFLNLRGTYVKSGKGSDIQHVASAIEISPVQGVKQLP